MKLAAMMSLGLVGGADAHGAVTHPKPRQAVDSSLAPWNGSVPAYPIPFGAHPSTPTRVMQVTAVCVGRSNLRTAAALPRPKLRGCTHRLAELVRIALGAHDRPTALHRIKRSSVLL